MRQLQRLAPGRSAAFAATTNRDGTVVTCSSDIATALRQHWQPTLALKAIDKGLLATWLEEKTLHPGRHSAFKPLTASALRSTSRVLRPLSRMATLTWHGDGWDLWLSTC